MALGEDVFAAYHPNRLDTKPSELLQDTVYPRQGGRLHR